MAGWSARPGLAKKGHGPGEVEGIGECLERGDVGVGQAPRPLLGQIDESARPILARSVADGVDVFETAEQVSAPALVPLRHRGFGREPGFLGPDGVDPTLEPGLGPEHRRIELLALRQVVEERDANGCRDGVGGVEELGPKGASRGIDGHGAKGNHALVVVLVGALAVRHPSRCAMFRLCS